MINRLSLAGGVQGCDLARIRKGIEAIATALVLDATIDTHELVITRVGHAGAIVRVTPDPYGAPPNNV